MKHTSISLGKRDAKPRGMGRGGPDNSYDARIAVDAATMADAHRLRYLSYLASGHIAPNVSGMFADRFDDLPNATTVVVYNDGAAVGSVRTCMLRRGPGTTSPGRETYPDHVEALLRNSGPERAGYDGLEVNRLVRSPEAANDQGLVFLLLRLAGHLGLAADFRVAISCVRTNHVPFYRRVGFREVAEPRPYPGLKCPMALLSLGRLAYDETRAEFPLMDPEAGVAGSLHGLENGETVRPPTIRRG